MSKNIIAAALALSFTALPALAANSDSLYDQFSKKGSVPFTVSITENKSSLNPSQLKELQQNLVDQLTNRRSITFAPSTPEAADVNIDIAVNEYYWTEEDPIDMITSVPLAIYDAATNEHYTRIMAQFSVIDARSKKVLWKDVVKSTVSDATMTETEGFEQAIDELASNFISKAFKKSKK